MEQSSFQRRRDFRQAVFSGLVGALNDHLQDQDVQEVMVNPGGQVWVERQGSVQKAEQSLLRAETDAALKILAKLAGEDTFPTGPAIIDARHQGMRVAAVYEPISHGGSALCIRKHSETIFPLESYEENLSHRSQLVRQAATTRPEIAENGSGMTKFLHWLLESHQTCIVSGGTSSGKTSFLNALLQHQPIEERTLSIEDTHELKLVCENWVPLVANKRHNVSIRDLVRLCLRFRPDRIVVGEIRGPEAFDFLQAMNTGHSGGLVSLHANTASETLSRLESLVLTAGIDWPHEAIRQQVAQSIDFIINCAKVGGTRGPVEIVEVVGYENGQYNLNPIWRIGETK